MSYGMSGGDPNRLRVDTQMPLGAIGWTYAIVYGDPPIVLARSPRSYSSHKSAMAAGTREMNRARAAMGYADADGGKDTVGR